MKPIISTKKIALPAVCKREVLRYAGTREDDTSSLTLLDECIEELKVNAGKVSYCKLKVKKEGNRLDFGPFSLTSKNLANFFDTATESVLFLATVGVEIDRLITKYSLLSPAKALMFQALGTERVEALCDCFSDFIKVEENLKTCARFSPGYGDSPLSVQKDIIALLEGNKTCGVFVNDSFLLSPSKTVTAFIRLQK